MARAALLVGLLSVPLGFIATTYGPPIARGMAVFGVTRSPVAGQYESIVNIEGTGICEAIFWHEDSSSLFTACEQSLESRMAWFPGLASLNANGVAKSDGRLYVIDSKTQKANRISLVHFKGPLITHGMDVVPDPDWPEVRPGTEAVYIVLVNHLPNPAYLAALQSGADTTGIDKARSRLEVFHHIIGSSIAMHEQSVWSPLIRTPNDVLALSRNEFLVTNDHYYREGHMRALEDMYYGAEWTETVYIRTKPGDKTGEIVEAYEVTAKMHNVNGIARGPGADDIAIAGAAGGRLHLGKLTASSSGGVAETEGEGAKFVNITETIDLESVADNPTYFSDPYATSDADDKSGWIVPGLSKAITLAKTKLDPKGMDPSLVYLLRKDKATGKWEKRVIFEDDGSRIRSASGAALVAIDPKEEGGKRKAWLYVTGFISSNVIAVKVDL